MLLDIELTYALVYVCVSFSFFVYYENACALNCISSILPDK